MDFIKRTLVGLAAVLLLAPALAIAGAPKPTIMIENPGQCIASVDEMRRNHMGMLQHTRDRTMRQGIRGEKASLNECINCHASKTTGSVLGKDGFCESCHAYAAVKVDCWQCHQPKAGYKHAGTAGAKP
ncbi:MAG: hypothetical protein Q8L56_10365 [Rhodocyclaceae bacterium]|nr:hypothetical protein [Rhodocyclaceae bacterium]